MTDSNCRSCCRCLRLKGSGPAPPSFSSAGVKVASRAEAYKRQHDWMSSSTSRNIGSVKPLRFITVSVFLGTTDRQTPKSSLRLESRVASRVMDIHMRRRRHSLLGVILVASSSSVDARLVPAVVVAFSAASSSSSSLGSRRRRGRGWPSHRVASTIDDDAEDKVAAVDDNEMELQRRYEAAMRRREERRRKSASASTKVEDVDWSLNAAAGGATMESMILSIDANLNAYERTVMIENEKSNSNDNADREKRSTTRRKDRNGRKVKAITENEIVNDDPMTARRSRRRTARLEEWDGTASWYETSAVGSSSTDDIPRSRYGIESRDPYDEYSEDDDDNDDDIRNSLVDEYASCEWETYRSSSILFPPIIHDKDSRRIRRRPSAIIHFIGGTVFGSYPRRFYGTLLEDIARKCDAVVVATSIPIVLPGISGLKNSIERWMFDDNDEELVGYGSIKRKYNQRMKEDRKINVKNPLDHFALAEQVQTEFNNAYRDVILDEYCTVYDDDDDKEVEDFMKNVPIVGIGHSLGARIQAVSCTDPRIYKRCLSMGKRNRLIRSGREGMVYLGFANWSAKSAIPGVETLDDAIRKRTSRRPSEDRRDRRDGVGRGDGSRRRSRRRDSNDDGVERGRYSRYERQYDVEDLDLIDVFGDVVSTVAKSVKQIGEALTPEAENLEFSPTPNKLWDDLSSSDGWWYGKSCRNNLIVQFDDDQIDQGSRLARTLLSAYSAELNTTSSITEEDDSSRPKDKTLSGVKFARLSGGHLTPVTAREDIEKVLPRKAVSLLSSSYNFLAEQVDGRRRKSTAKQRKDVEDVADTVASFIRSLNNDK